MNKRIAIVLGATGLVGRQLVTQLLTNESYGRIKVFVRRSTGIRHEKLEEHLVDFDEPGMWSDQVTGDVLFSAFGTTIRKAGSQDAQYKVDYTYQYNMAKAAAENGVGIYVLISAAYSSPESKVFYSRIKGQLEQAVLQLAFKQIHIIRPGMLDGKRKEFRIVERIGIPLMHILSYVPGLGALKPIKDNEVAKGMINAADKTKTGKFFYNLKEVFQLAGRKI